MNIYQELILDHYQNPRCHGKLSMQSGTFHLENPSCGDIIDMQILIRNNRIQDIAFEGKGCAISQASASLLCEHAKGSRVEDIKQYDAHTIIELLGIDIGPARMKCALLSLETLHSLIRTAENRSVSNK